MRRNFDQWLADRQNIVRESWWDDFLGRAPKRPAPTPSAPEAPKPGTYPHPDNEPAEPSQVLTHPMVEKYYKDIVHQLMLDRPLEIVDAEGNKKGDFNGHLPDEIERTLRRFIGAHVIGGRQSFLRVNQHDAILLLNYLDRLRVPGEEVPLTDRFGITTPQSLSQWMETRLPTNPTAIRQQGFAQANASYMPRRAGPSAGLRDPKVRALAEAAVKVINGVHAKTKSDSKNRRLTMDIIEAAKEMRAALESMGVLIPEAPDMPAPAPAPAPKGSGGTPPAPGDPADLKGRGRADPL